MAGTNMPGIYKIKKKDSETLRSLINDNALSGKTILLLFEGGLGDTLQFIRYAQILKEAGATIIVRAQNPLHPLLSRCPYIDQLLHPNDPIPPHHARATLMSLPAILGLDATELATTIPYIFPEASLVQYWKEKLHQMSANQTDACSAQIDPATQTDATTQTNQFSTQTDPTSPKYQPNFTTDFQNNHNSQNCNAITNTPLNQNSKNQTTVKKLTVGICWQADVFNDTSRAPVAHRGIPLKLLATLSTIPGVTLYSLQKKDGLDQLEQLNNLPNHRHIIIHTLDELDEQNGPFMDTAAIMQNLDLIISADSAIAHLAGALGRPVWLLLPYVTDWRWLHNRTDSPWYPTMRIFKQQKAFDWESVAQQVHEQVCQLVNTQ